jgi:hypothetical protein
MRSSYHFLFFNSFYYISVATISVHFHYMSCVNYCMFRLFFGHHQLYALISYIKFFFKFVRDIMYEVFANISLRILHYRFFAYTDLYFSGPKRDANPTKIYATSLRVSMLEPVPLDNFCR